MYKKYWAFIVFIGLFVFGLNCNFSFILPIYGSESISEKTATKAFLKVQDVSEIDIDGRDSIVVSFSSVLKKDQNFDEKLHLIDNKTGKIDGTWVLSKDHQELIFSHLEPNRKVILTIDAGIDGDNGQKLEKEHVTKLTTRDLQPNVSFASQGSLFPLRLAEGLPIITLNVKQAMVEFFKIPNDQLVSFFTERGSNTNLENYELNSLTKNADLVYTGSFKLNAEKNRRQKVLLPIASIRELQKPGVYFAVLRQAGGYDDHYPATLFTLSDIGLSVHRYQNNDQLSVFTQSLETGDPLAQVELSALDKKGHVITKVFSDQQGYANLTNISKAKNLLAIQNGQTTLLSLESSALDLSEFKVEGEENHSLQFFVFGPRDLYRPGETVLLNALLRDEDGQQLKELPVRAFIYSAEGKMVQNFVWQPSEVGFYQYQFQLPVNASTGNWSLVIKAGKKELRNYSFKVEDFLPERLGLALQATHKDNQPLNCQQDMKVAVKGWYLYGAPASQNLLTGTVYMRPLREAVSQLAGFVFGNQHEKDLTQKIDFDDIHLDQQGRALIQIANHWKDIKSPIQLITEASLFETGGRPVVRHFMQAVWPAEQLVGIRPLFDNDRVPDSHDAKFEIVLADVQGHKLAGQNLKARLIEERHDYYWTYSESKGWDSNFNKKDIIKNEQNLTIDKDKTVALSYPVEWGDYRLEVENPATGMLTSYSFHVGYDIDQGNVEENLRPDQVKITLDKVAYNAGDVAQITLTPPADGKGYLMVESSDQLLWKQSINASAKGTAIKLPIDSKWLSHDLYISSLIIRPGDRKIGATPKRAIGIVHLPLQRQERRLNLQMTFNAKVEPLTTQRVKVKVTDFAGHLVKNAKVLISAVDTGVLNITDYKTPDPFKEFFQRKAYNVDQLDVYGKLIEAGQNPLASFAFGGDAMAKGGKHPDTNVKIVMVQSQPVAVNDQGEAEIPINIPDFNGELRLMAQVWTDNQFGMAENKMTVAAPIVVEMSTPRFLASGDVAVLALDLTNMTEKAQKLSIKLQSDGLITLQSPQNQNVLLAKNERQTLKIPVRAKIGMGYGILRADVSGIVSSHKNTSKTIHRSWRIGTRPSYMAQSNIVQSVLKEEAWKISPTVMHNVNEIGREGILQLSAYPPLNLSKQINALQAYPYGCAEQTTSGIYPSLYVNADLLKQLHIKNKQTDLQRHDAINAGIGHLLTMQRGNGSFGLWDSDSSEEYWLSVYVTDFLIQARDRGYMVPEDALQKALKRLLMYVQNKNIIDPEYSLSYDETRFAVQTYAGYVLARTKQVPLAALRDLYNHRSMAPSGLSLVQLSASLKLMGDKSRAVQVLNEGLRYNKRVHDWWIGDYGSDIRDNALILALLQENHLVDDNIIMQRLFDLSQQLKDYEYLSTQEENAVFLAGYRFVSKPDTVWQTTVDIAGHHYQLDNKHSALSFTDEEMRFIHTLNLVNKIPRTPVYATINLTGYPLQSPAEIEKQDLYIYKEFLDLQGNPVDLHNVKSGTLMLVKLTLFSRDRMHDALLVDFLPAGLELENQNLSNVSVNLQDAGEAVKKSLEIMEDASIQHQEYRDDRYVAQLDLSGQTNIIYLVRAVTPGNYHVPAAMVQSMYRPNQFARTDSNKILIVKP